MSLPEALQGAVAAWLAGQGGSRREGTASLSATYRAGGSSASIDLGAYLVARLPATFAAVARVLGELAARRPAFSPTSLLDAGSGPGTASWAAAAQWPGLEAVTFLDSSPHFLDLAAALSRRGPEPLPGATPVRGSIEAFGRDSGKAVTSIVLSSNVTLGNDRPADPGVAAWFTWDGMDCVASGTVDGMVWRI